MFDAFGFERLMWGADWTRCAGLLTYKEGVESFLLSDWLGDGERVRLMGGTLQAVYKWSPESG